MVLLIPYIKGFAFMATLRNFGYDALLRRFHTPARSDAVVIVDIDEPSLKELGQWPWSRYQVGDLIRKIREAGATVIGLDMVFPEKDRTSPIAIEKQISKRFGSDVRFQGLEEQYRDFDNLLAHELSLGKTVLGCYMWQKISDADPVDPPEQMDPDFRSVFFTRGDGSQYVEQLLKARSILFSIPELKKAAGNNAYFNAQPDADNVVRRNPLVWTYGTRIYPAVATEALRVHLGVDNVGIEYDENGITGLRFRDIFVPTDEFGNFTVNFRTVRKREDGVPTSFPSYSAIDVLEGRVESNLLAGRIVFIGTSAIGLRDLRSTPLVQGYSGVEVHANIIDNVLTGDVLADPYLMRLADLVSILLAGILITLIVNRYRSWVAFIFSLLVLGTSIYLSIYLFHRNLIYVPSYLAVTVLVTYPLLTTLKFWKQEAQERWIRGRFGEMVSDAVLRYLEQHPDEIQQGKKTEATILFCDIQGFTGVSETMEPTQIARFLNTFFNHMSEIVMRHNGYIDKYIGDMIMAVWGVPFPNQHHAAEGCRCALEMLEKLQEIKPAIKAEFGVDLNIRMGINSGKVTAGNMGSSQRYEYTVIGEAVNIAARLEPLNKQYNTNCIIGEETELLARGQFKTRELGEVQVRGKTRPTKIFELVS